MALRFTVLASGSGGNASLIEAGDSGILIDMGLGPRQLAARLTVAERAWSAVHAVVLTHTHSDHWKDATLAHLHRRRIPLYCHPGHHATLRSYSAGFPALEAAGLVCAFEAGCAFAPAPGLRCRPFPVRHDGGATFGFRIEETADLFGHAPALAYAADLGCWDETLAGHLADVDLLAIEFNHDVALERTSGRGARLIARVLGDDGHLSNDQAVALVRAALARSAAGRLRHLVQLHLSQDCNRPHLARSAAEVLLTELGAAAEVHTAEQDAPGSTLHLGAVNGQRRGRRPFARRPAGTRVESPPAPVQRWLPGFNGEEEGRV